MALELRKNTAKNAVLVGTCCAALTLCPTAFARKPLHPWSTATLSRLAAANDYDPRRDPEKDLADAKAEAQKSGKNILIVVGGEWCSWCHTLDRFFREHSELAELRDKNYVTIKVNMSQENQNRAFLSRFPRIHGYPHLLVLDSDGNLIKSQPTNELEQGNGYNAERFRKFLEDFTARSKS
jgi:thiol:disulfide interchange protein